MRRLLEQHERDIAWLARKLGRDQSHMWRVVNGERPLTRFMADEMAALFEVPASTFLPTKEAE